MAKLKAYQVKNPFIYDGYAGSDYFCDRIEESETLISHLKNGRNVTLVSPRKVGKTGLIKHTFHLIKEKNKDAVCLYVDIFHTHNQHEFVQILGKAIIEEKLLDSRNSITKVLNFFSLWRPTLTPDPMTGVPSISITIERSHSEHTIKSIFEYLENSGKEVYLAIDEFQTITDYPEKGTEALLRSYIQFIHNVHFIFSGSKQHIMYEIFGSAKRPFYQSTAIMAIEPLHKEIYYEFASRFFKNKKGELSEDVFNQLYNQFDGYTWYMQSVLNRLYEREKQVKDYRQVTEAILSVLSDKSNQYDTLMMFLTDNQLSLLMAIAHEGIVNQPQSKEFVRKYDLPTLSSIKKALEVLKEKELIYQTPEGYIVYDRFMAIWLSRI